MDTVVWDVIKSIISWLWIPFGIYMTYNLNRNNKAEAKTESMEHRLTTVEQQTKVLSIQIESIKDTVRDTKESIREVKAGVDKLVDRLLK